MTEPPSRSLRCAIIGAGMAGLLAGIKLKARGIVDFTIFEKNPDLGGTWFENRYPGLSCDVPAHDYTYSFAYNPEWTRYFPPGPEIHAYFSKVAEHYGVRTHIRLDTEITTCSYEDGSWRIGYAGGEYVADVVIAATGVLHHPRMPEIAGLESFAGPSFHSARWPGDLDPTGKRVGIIGGGSSGVQIVSALVGKASKVVHFCRTPQWILSTPDAAYSEEDRAAFRDDPEKIRAVRDDPDYLEFKRRFSTAIIDADSREMVELDQMVRANLENSVADPSLRAKLTPSYRPACKRLISSPNYYDKIQHPAAYLETSAIDRIGADGVLMEDGSFHPLDVLVFATGFQADRFVRPMVVTGEDGQALDTLWARRPTAYLAITLPGFPNFFMLNGPTGPVGNFSLIDIAERQWGYIDQLLDLLRDGSARAVQPTREALNRYENERIAAAKGTIWASGCSSWYLDDEGIPASWPWSLERFIEAMSAPVLDDFRVS